MGFEFFFKNPSTVNPRLKSLKFHADSDEDGCGKILANLHECSRPGEEVKEVRCVEPLEEVVCGAQRGFKHSVYAEDEWPSTCGSW